jgi:hypothetical protein
MTKTMAAKGTIEMACVDLAAKAAGLPACPASTQAHLISDRCERLSQLPNVSSAAPLVPAHASPRPTSKRHRNKQVPMLAAGADSPALARLAAAQQTDRADGMIEVPRIIKPEHGDCAARLLPQPGAGSSGELDTAATASPQGAATFMFVQATTQCARDRVGRILSCTDYAGMNSPTLFLDLTT